MFIYASSKNRKLIFLINTIASKYVDMYAFSKHKVVQINIWFKSSTHMNLKICGHFTCDILTSSNIVRAVMKYPPDPVFVKVRIVF